MSQEASAALAQLASHVVDLRLPIRVDPGTVVLAFKNGAPLAVLRPGKVHRRIIGGLPGMGRLKGMTLSTAHIPLDVTVRDVRLEGIHPLEAVKVTLSVAINPDNDYQGLLAYSGAKGVNFAQILYPELRAEIEGRVRDALRPHAVEDVYDSGAGLDAAAFGTAPMLNGLFRIEQIFFSEPTFHTGFLEEREIKIRKRAESVEKVEELKQHDLNLLLDKSQDMRALEQARRRGLSLNDFENPQLAEADNQRAHEIRLALIEQLGELRRAGGSEAVSRMMETLAGGGSGSTDGGTIPLHHSVGPLGAADDIDASTTLAGLLSDPTLADLWRREELPGTADGLGQAQATVLVVTSGGLEHAEVARIDDVYRRHARAGDVIVLDRVRSMEDLVLRFLRNHAPEVMEPVSALSLSVTGSHLTVLIASDGHRISPVTQHLNDPAIGVLDPLAQVLPFDVIDVRSKPA